MRLPTTRCSLAGIGVRPSPFSAPVSRLERIVEPGAVELGVGASATDIRARAQLEMAGL